MLANIINSLDTNLSDSFGQITLEKMYLLDAQITYNYDTYYNNFINQNPITIFLAGFPVGTVPALTAFDEINNTAQSTVGFSLTQDLQVIDAYRQVLDTNNMNQILNYPTVRFGYNQLRDGLISPADIASSLVPLIINPTEIDYFLHNPESFPLFCSEYNLYGSCSGQDGLNFNLTNILQEIDSFF